MTIAAGPELVVTATATLDPATAIFGRPLDETSWDFTARNTFLGGINERGLRTSHVSGLRYKMIMSISRTEVALAL